MDDFIDPATGQIRFVFFPAGSVRSDWITDVSAMIDRVTLRALKAGRTVSSDALAPPGSPAGPSAGIPPGMEGVLVDSAQIEDLDLLRPGARFDIVSGRVILPGGLGDQVRRTISSSNAVEEANKLPNFAVPFVRTVARGAVMLTQFDTTDRTEREIVTDRTTITRATLDGGIEEVQTSEQPRVESETLAVTRFAIAVPASQAALLVGFLDRGTPLRVVLESTRPEETSPSEASPSRSQTPQTDDPASVSLFIREHFYGSEAPFTEVFVSERRYPKPALSKNEASQSVDMPHE